MRESAGILLYRFKEGVLQFFLVHPGGPFWKKKDEGAWTIPKGEFTKEEEPLSAAKREFQEETGFTVEGNFIQLTPIKQKGGKIVHAWAIEGDIDAAMIKSNTLPLQWPPGSKKWIQVPEVDKGEWYKTEEAKLKINSAQAPFIDQLVSIINT